MRANNWLITECLLGLGLLVAFCALLPESFAQAQTATGVPAQQTSGATPATARPVIAPPAVAAPAVSGNYILKPSDAVMIRVYEEPDLTVNARLANDGTIVMPLVGEIKVEGMTVRQASQRIEQALRKDYLVNPQVLITLSERTVELFTILGQVVKPGSYPMPAEGKCSLSRAVAMAGGYTKLASMRKITVKRTVKGRDLSLKVDGKKEARGDSDSQITILPGDTISVGERIF